MKNAFIRGVLLVVFSAFCGRATAQSQDLSRTNYKPLHTDAPVPELTGIDFIGPVSGGPFPIFDTIKLPINKASTKITYHEQTYDLLTDKISTFSFNLEYDGDSKYSLWYILDNLENKDTLFLKVPIVYPGDYTCKIVLTLPIKGQAKESFRVQSLPFPLQIRGCQVTASPKSAKPFDELVLSLSPPFEQPPGEATSNLSVRFAENKAMIKEVNKNGIKVFVPDLPEGWTPEISISYMGTPIALPYTGFTIAPRASAGPGWFTSVIAGLFGIVVTAVAFGWALRYFDPLKLKEPNPAFPQIGQLVNVSSRDEKTRRMKVDFASKDTNEQEVAKTEAPPVELAEACASGNCVLFTGAGVARQGGMSDFGECLIRVCERARDTSEGLNHNWSLPIQAAERGDLMTASDLIRNWLSEETILDLMAKEYVREPGASNQIYDVLRQLNFAGVLNWSCDSKIRT